MAVYRVKLKVEYTAEILVEGVTSAEDARLAAVKDASRAVEQALFDRGAPMTIGQTKSLDATCVSEFA